MSNLITQRFLKMDSRISKEKYEKLFNDCKDIDCFNTACSMCSARVSCMKLRRCEATNNKPYGY